MSEYNGYLVVNKKRGTGSTDYVRIVKKHLNQKKVGHSGTLDLLARGVLVICVGKATKMIEYLQENKKTYIATIKFGEQTDTLDTEGSIINKTDKKVYENELLDIIPNFIGDITQIPPMYSALKLNGKRLYDLARKGITVERKPRNIKIYSLELINFDFDKQECVIKTTVSAGTYIRTLIDDLGIALNNFAHMTDLVRTQCSGFTIDDSFTIEDENSEGVINKIIPLEEVLFDFNKLNVNDEIVKNLKNGMTCKINSDVKDDIYLVLSKDKVLGVANVFETSKGKMLKLLKHLY